MSVSPCPVGSTTLATDGAQFSEWCRRIPGATEILLKYERLLNPVNHYDLKKRVSDHRYR